MITLQPVAHWRLWWRRWSTWLASFNAAFVTSALTKSGALLSFVPFLPGPWRYIALALVFVLSWLTPVVAVCLRQPRLAEKCAQDAPRK